MQERGKNTLKIEKSGSFKSGGTGGTVAQGIYPPVEGVARWRRGGINRALKSRFSPPPLVGHKHIAR